MTSATSTLNTTAASHHSAGAGLAYNSPQILEVKSKYDAEFRRFGLVRHQYTKYEEFYQLLERLHGLYGIQFNIYYTDKDGDLLPINNDNNFGRVQQVTAGILRLIILRKGECYPDTNSYLSSQISGSSMSATSSSGGSGVVNASYRATQFISHINPFHHGPGSSSAKPFQISHPEDFRPVSAIIDVDILPDSYRRVRLHKHKSSKPLGFYIRDGRSLRVTPNGVEQVPGIFISRLMPGGLAESTGLLSVNDEVIEVNGIEVAGKTLDQVTDMMVANSSNLIITVKPTNQKYNLNKSILNSTTSVSNNTSLSSAASATLNMNMKNITLNNHSQNNASFLSGKTSTASVNKPVVSSGNMPKLNSTLNTGGTGGAGGGGGASSMSSSSINSSFSSINKYQSNERSSFKSLSHQKPQAPVLPTHAQHVNNHHEPKSESSETTTNNNSSSHHTNKKDPNSDVDYGLEEDSEEEDDDDDDDEEIHDATNHNGDNDADEKILTL